MLVMHNFPEGEHYEKGNLVHTEVGKRMADDMKLGMNYSYVEDPTLSIEMEAKGLIWSVRRNDRDERYIVAAPRQQVEEGIQLPVVLYIQETYEGNEHLPISGIRAVPTVRRYGDGWPLKLAIVEMSVEKVKHGLGGATISEMFSIAVTFLK